MNAKQAILDLKFGFQRVSLNATWVLVVVLLDPFFPSGLRQAVGYVGIQSKHFFRPSLESVKPPLTFPPFPAAIADHLGFTVWPLWFNAGRQNQGGLSAPTDKLVPRKTCPGFPKLDLGVFS